MDGFPDEGRPLLEVVMRDFSGDEIQCYLEVFLEEHADAFACDEHFLHLPVEMHEQKHEWFCIFQKFVEGVDDRLRDFLMQRGWSQDDFVYEASRVLSGELDVSVQESEAMALLKVTLSLVDYTSFLDLVKNYVLRRTEGAELSAIFVPSDIKPRSRTRGESLDTSDISTIASVTGASTPPPY